jgi:hypothetical protein
MILNEMLGAQGCLDSEGKAKGVMPLRASPEGNNKEEA